MLDAYLLQTRQLLQNPAAPNSLYTTADLTSYINRARVQLAGDAECTRVYATLPITATTRQYPFSTIDLGSAPGVAGIYNARIAWLQVGTGQVWIRPRPWAWFGLYELNNPAPDPGPPAVWSQFGQGSTGSLFISPVPDIDYTLTVDVVALPIPLVDDSTVEAIPPLFTDAVPFFAAYYALLSAQSATRQADADRMFARYEEFRNRARKMSNPSVNDFIYEQTGDPVRANRLGEQQGGAA